MNLLDRARVHAALGDPHRLAIVDAVALGDRSPKELAALLSTPTNLLAHHLNVLERAGVVVRRVSEGDGRRRYVALDRSRLGGLRSADHVAAGSVLFVCTHNSARSQYAAALWRQRTGRDVASAGTHPAAKVNPKAARVAREFGVDIGQSTPRGYGDVTAAPDLVVSVCDRAGESPLPFESHRLHWSIPDPVPDGRLAAFRSAFSEITARIDQLALAAGAPDA